MTRRWLLMMNDMCMGMNMILHEEEQELISGKYEAIEQLNYLIG